MTSFTSKWTLSNERISFHHHHSIQRCGITSSSVDFIERKMAPLFILTLIACIDEKWGKREKNRNHMVFLMGIFTSSSRNQLWLNSNSIPTSQLASSSLHQVYTISTERVKKRGEQRQASKEEEDEEEEKKTEHFILNISQIGPCEEREKKFVSWVR